MARIRKRDLDGMSGNVSTNHESARFTLFYDGDCPMCRSTVSLLSRLSLLRKVQAVAWDTGISDNPSIQALIQSEVVLLDTLQDTYQSGADALLQLLRIHNRLPLLTTLFGLPPLNKIFRFCYKAVALNRRLISPRPKIACACDPPFYLPYRLVFCGLLVMTAITGTLGFAASLATFSERPFLALAEPFLVTTAYAWILNFAVLPAIPENSRLDYIQQYLVVTALGGLALVPVSAAIWFGNMVGLPIPALLMFALFGVIFSTVLMIRSFRRRIGTLGCPAWLLWFWLGLWISIIIPLLFF